MICETQDTLARRAAAIQSLQYVEKNYPGALAGVLPLYGKLINAEKELAEVERGLYAALKVYQKERIASLLASWIKRGLEYCDYRCHLAPKKTVRIVAIRHWRRGTEGEMKKSHDSMHRLCADCKNSLQSSHHAIKMPGSTYSVRPSRAQTIVKHRKVWGGISTENDFGDWNKPEKLIEIPRAVPEDFERLITESDNIPHAVYFKQNYRHGVSALRVDGCEQIDFKAFEEFMSS